jgi:prepilin-type processing-associated H-X9-DG protein
MAKQVQCLSNLRQVGMSIAMYLNDNKGFFPGPSQRSPLQTYPWDWVYFRPEQGPTQNSAIAPYLWPQWADGEVPPVLVCPSDDNTYRPATFNNEPYPYSYTMNATVAGYYTNYSPTMNVAQISNSSEKILLIEETEDSINDGDWWPFGYDLLSTRHDRHLVEADTYGNDLDHRGNVAFVDGHGQFVPRSYVQDPSHWDATLP